MNVIDVDIKSAVEKELQAATERFGLHNSNHEKMAVIAEEFEECEEALAKLRQSVHCAWSRTRDNCDSDMMDDAYGRIYGAAVSLAIEACQTAAMADKEIKRMEESDD